jgi:DNA-binding transcriptional regulator YiaG
VTPQDVLRIRRELGLTRRRLAEILGVDRTAVSRWETGARVMQAPTEKLLERILADHREIRREA